MKCAIMQPTYMPWAGYFNLISKVNTFVFLDDVQFDRRSWQMRNRILHNGKEKMLSVSTIKVSRDALCCNIALANSLHWYTTHVNLITEAYKDAPFFQDLAALLELLSHMKYDKLVDLNVAIIKLACEQLKLDTNFVLASDLNCEGRRAEHLGLICSNLGASEYISPMGSKAYLETDDFSNHYPNVKLTFNDFKVASYPQLSQTFVGYLSILDLVANIGWQQAKDYVR